MGPANADRRSRQSLTAAYAQVARPRGLGQSEHVRIAVLTDVHGNGHALEAVLPDLARQAVDTVVFGGDAALFGSRPRECWERISAEGWPCVQGNTDRYIVDLSSKLATLGTEEAGFARFLQDNAAWTRDALGETAVREMDAMESEVRLDSPGGAVQVVHGVAGNDELGLLRDDSDNQISGKIGDMNSTVLVCAHTHTAFVRHVGEALIVNCGSVGRTHDGIPGIASYAVLDDGSGRWSAAIRRVPYDHLAAHAETLTLGVPIDDDFARTLLNGLQPR